MKIKNPKGCNLVYENGGKYTEEMYRGNIPACHGSTWLVDGTTPTVSDHYSCRFGGGDVINDRVMTASFNLNEKVCIHIIGGTISVFDIRYSGKSDFWEWSNNPNYRTPGSCRHELEKDRLDEYLHAEVEDCLLWDLIRKRIDEIMNAEISLTGKAAVC